MKYVGTAKFANTLFVTPVSSSHTITESSTIPLKYLLHSQLHVQGFQL